MPVEERFITFSLEEIHSAVRVKCVDEKLERPARGELVSIEINEEDEAAQNDVSFKIKREDNGKEEEFKFERAFFGQALVFYCQGHGIPLPKRGQKILKIAPNQVTMKVMTGAETAEAA